MSRIEQLYHNDNIKTELDSQTVISKNHKKSEGCCRIHEIPTVWLCKQEPHNDTIHWHANGEISQGPMSRGRAIGNQLRLLRDEEAQIHAPMINTNCTSRLCVHNNRNYRNHNKFGGYRGSKGRGEIK